MEFLMMFLRGVALVPSVVQSVEALNAAKTGDAKRQAAIGIVGNAINVTDAVAQKTIVDANAFTGALGTVVDGVVAALNASVWAKK